MDVFLKRNYGLPVAWRWAEGLSNAMLVGHLWAGGDAYSPLTLVYAVHWVASLNYHVRPCFRHFEMDVFMIELVTVERLYLIFPSHLLWAAALWLFVIADLEHTYIGFVKVAFAVALAVCGSRDRVKTWWIICFLLGMCCYVAADWCLWASMMYTKSLAHIGFHVCMTLAAYLEVGMRPPRDGRFDGMRLVVYGARLLYR